MFHGSAHIFILSSLFIVNSARDVAYLLQLWILKYTDVLKLSDVGKKNLSEGPEISNVHFNFFFALF